MADIIKDIMENVPAWQFNVIPGNANQGAILTTTKPLTNPPFKQSDFIWKPMEDIIGTADIKLEYSEEDNIYSLYKAKGHLDNEGSWSYQWELVGQWEPITEEVAEALRSLVYVSYRYDLSIPNTLKVYGIKKDSTEDLLCNIQFASSQYVDDAVDAVQAALNNEITRATTKENQIETNLNNEITRATTRENELEDMIEHNIPISGSTTTVTQSSSGRIVDVNVDNDSVKVNSSNQLKADVFDDTQVTNTKGWSSAKISQEMVGAMHYKGQVATYADLPTSGMQAGDLYNVEDTGDNYAWDATNNRWDKQSGDYIAGTGIDITGKVISATGIAFSVGDGLQTSGTGSTTTLLTKNGVGLEYGTNRENKVKAGNAITVDANGVGVNTGDTTQTINNNIEVKPNKGLVNETTGLSVNANFNIKTTPLGTESSKLAIYSDGKIGVDFTESPVVLSAELLATRTMSGGNINLNNIPHLNEYDMYIIEMRDLSINGSIEQSLLLSRSTQTSFSNTAFNVYAYNPSNPDNPPSGLVYFYAASLGVDMNNNNLGTLRRFRAQHGSTITWNKISESSTFNYPVYVYGIKAR